MKPAYNTLKRSMFIVPLAILLFINQRGWSQAPAPLTNGVPLLDGGLRFAMCDDLTERPVGSELNDTEFFADRPLTWIVLYGSSNRAPGVVYLGMSNSFSITVTTSNGSKLTKTAKGEGMSAGPTSITNFRANKNLRMRPVGYTDFPSMAELFNFPSNGVYIAEIRYWTWMFPLKRFVLSDPIRVKVIKRDTESAPAKAPKG